MASKVRKTKAVEQSEEDENIEQSVEEEVEKPKKTSSKGGSKKTMDKTPKKSPAKSPAPAKSSAKSSTKSSTKSPAKSPATKPVKKQSVAGAKKMSGGSKTQAKAPVAKKETEEDEGKRYFKLINEDGSTKGRYTGETPKQAASKGYTKMLQQMKKDGEKIPKHSIIYLRESTRGSQKNLLLPSIQTKIRPTPKIKYS